MTARSDTFPVYLEVGQKQVVAGAPDWPGWCRRNLPRTWQCC